MVQGVGEWKLKVAAILTAKAATEISKCLRNQGARAACTLDLAGH